MSRAFPEPLLQHLIVCSVHGISSVFQLFIFLICDVRATIAMPRRRIILLVYHGQGVDHGQISKRKSISLLLIVNRVIEGCRRRR